MESKKPTIKPVEARMLQKLKQTPRKLSVNELAKKSNMSWKTADKYLTKWSKKGLVEKSNKKIFSPTFKKPIMKPVWTIKRSMLKKIIKK